MPIVPLGQKSYKRTDGFVPEVVLRNLYLEKDDSGISPDGTIRVQRPGLSRDATYGNPIRTLHLWLGVNQQIVVSANTLIVNGAPSGYIGGEGIAPATSTNFFTAVLGGTQAYLWNGAVTPVSMPDARAVADIDQINGYVLLLTPTGRFYWMAPGDSTVDALNFATAESSPDSGIAIRRLGDEFWIFGASTIEPWQPTGDADLPFQRASGRVYERGCLSRDTVRRFDNSIVWVGDDCIVYRGGAVPEAISDNSIAERIRRRTGDLSAWTFGIDGHKFYVLRIPGQTTLAFDALTKAWCEFTSSDWGTWLPHVGYDLNGTTYAGSHVDGAIYTLDGTSWLDDGEPMIWAVTGTVPVSGKPTRNDSITIGVGASSDCNIRLRWKDGQLDYPDFYEDLEVRAPYDLTGMWRLGSPDAPYRTFEISGNPAARVRLSGMMANEDWT
jgi:hypothetical protein